MQNRNQHPLELELLKIMNSATPDAEKNLQLKTCLDKIHECKDVPAPSLDVEDSISPEGDTPLIWGAYHNNSLCITTLIEAKVDINKPNGMGDTALGWSIYNQDYLSAQLLLNAGAAPNRLNNNQHTALDELLTIDPKRLYSLSDLRKLVECKAMPHANFDKLVEFIKSSDLNGEDGYMILSLLCEYHMEMGDKSPMSEANFEEARKLLKEMPTPSSVKLKDNELMLLIDTGIDQRQKYPTALLKIIKSYDTLFGHPHLFFKSSTSAAEQKPCADIPQTKPGKPN